MLNLITKQSSSIHNQNKPHIPNHLFEILIIDISESGIKNVLPKLINHICNIDETNLFVKSPFESKFQIKKLIKKLKQIGLRYFKHWKTFNEYLNSMNDFDLYNTDFTNTNKKCQVLIILNNMISVIVSKNIKSKYLLKAQKWKFILILSDNQIVFKFFFYFPFLWKTQKFPKRINFQ